jgi:hypothetical protein
MEIAKGDKNPSQDRVGLGWRRELAVGVLSHLDRIDVVEVIADDLFDAPRNERRALHIVVANGGGIGNHILNRVSPGSGQTLAHPAAKSPYRGAGLW